MAVEELQESVAKLHDIQAQIKAKKEELERLRKAHLAFWKEFQEECGKTGHSLTQKERDALHGKCYAWTGDTVADSLFFLKMQHGCRCKYCLRFIPGRIEHWGKELDLCKKERFNNWIGYQEDKWPSHKKKCFERVKKEVDEFFSKSEPLEQELEVLKVQEQEITASLEVVWELLDKGLGKDIERERALQELCSDYEYRINSLRPKSYDPDMYYPD